MQGWVRNYPTATNNVASGLQVQHTVAVYIGCSYMQVIAQHSHYYIRVCMYTTTYSRTGLAHNITRHLSKFKPARALNGSAVPLVYTTTVCGIGPSSSGLQDCPLTSNLAQQLVCGQGEESVTMMYSICHECDYSSSTSHSAIADFVCPTFVCKL